MSSTAGRAMSQLGGLPLGAVLGTAMIAAGTVLHGPCGRLWECSVGGPLCLRLTLCLLEVLR